MTTRDMSNNEAIQMLNRCKHEIQELRQTIAYLKPRADAYDNLAIVLNLLPRTSQGFGEDIIWVIQKRIDELTPKASVPETNPVPVSEKDIKTEFDELRTLRAQTNSICDADELNRIKAHMNTYEDPIDTTHE